MGMGKPVMSSFFDALWIITVMRDIRGTNIHKVLNVGVDKEVGADCVLPVFPHLKAPAQAAQEAQPVARGGEKYRNRWSPCGSRVRRPVK